MVEVLTLPFEVGVEPQDQVVAAFPHAIRFVRQQQVGEAVMLGAGSTTSGRRCTNSAPPIVLGGSRPDDE